MNYTSPIKKGDAPLTPAQFVARINASKDRVLPPIKQAEILATNPALAKYIGDAMAAAQAEAKINNDFNHQLAAYRQAVARLDRYIVAEGREAVYADEPTEEIDAETGEPITASVMVQSAIDPIPASIEQQVVDDEGNASTVMVDNPLIAQDETERAHAQAIIAGTPQPIKDWMAENG